MNGPVVESRGDAERGRAVLLRDVVATDGRIWLKSEWGPASDYWPAVSFSKRSVGELLRHAFRPQRDILLYIGTGSELTEDPRHRQRLLSAVSIEPNQILATQDCIPAESWARAQRDYRGRWVWSMPALQIWDIPSLPLARSVAPRSYAQLGRIENRGNVVEALADERESLLLLEIRSVAFSPPPKATAFSGKRRLLNLDDEVRLEIGRMAAGILNRVQRSGTEGTRLYPQRTMSETDIHIMLAAIWEQQGAKCFLCQGPLIPGSTNPLLQWSADRTDSADGAYSETNTRITHLGCNYAKNRVTLSEFEDWLMVVRGDFSALDS